MLIMQNKHPTHILAKKLIFTSADLFQKIQINQTDIMQFSLISLIIPAPYRNYDTYIRK